MTERSAGKRSGFHWHDPISGFGNIYFCWSSVDIHDFDLKTLLFQHNDSPKKNLWKFGTHSNQEFRVSFEFSRITVGFQLAGSEVFTVPTFRCLLVLPERPRSFAIMLLPCCQKLHIWGTVISLFQLFKKCTYFLHEKGRVTQRTAFSWVVFISCL